MNHNLGMIAIQPAGHNMELKNSGTRLMPKFYWKLMSPNYDHLLPKRNALYLPDVCTSAFLLALRSKASIWSKP
jgi:hypothetical protein